MTLEHNYKMEDDDLISGNFLISGEYKMTEGSINREKFEYTIPFDVALDSRYDTNNIVVDIDDFNYSIINNDILKIRIVLYIDGDLIKNNENNQLELKNNNNEIKEERINLEKEVEEPQIEKSVNYDRKEEKELPKGDVQPEIELNIENINVNNNSVEDDSKYDSSLFNNLESGETYSTYHVYIVKEEDTIDKIMEKYSVSKEDLSNYNDLNDIKPGDKVIIPTSYNG